MSWDMQSCDTLAVSALRSRYGHNLFGKNSDRPICESQPLAYFPPAEHKEGETVNCTGFVIPQVSHTNGVLGTKPYWIWGFEMGVNDCGVVIGNEAEFSRDFGKEKDEGLLGMDLLRLALERGSSAAQARDVIIELLERYGQNHNACALYDRRYENSFVIMDEHEIWVLETAGRRYAAKKVTDVYACGNTYSIGSDFDMASCDLEEHARENGWLLPNDRFDFEKAYSAPIPYVGLVTPRRRRVQKLADELPSHDFRSLKKIFRDHSYGEINEPRWGAASGVFQSVCMHAGCDKNSQTAASMLASYREGLGVVLRVAYSSPCCSIYLPVYPGIQLPEVLSNGGARFDNKSLWWLMDRLAKIISIDYDKFAPDVHRHAHEIERKVEARAQHIEAMAARLVCVGNIREADNMLYGVMEDACRFAKVFAVSAYHEIRQKLSISGVTSLCGQRKEFLEKYCELSGMELL